MSRSVLQELPERVAPPAGQADVTVHGVLGARLINAAPPDAAAILRQLGARPGEGPAEPDLTVEFVEDLAGTGLCHVASPQACFAEDGLLRLHHGATQAAIDFGSIGRRCRIVCETGIGKIPLLEPIADLSILSKGLAAMHASAFIHRGRGIVATGWAHGGKSTAALAFARRGATFVSDDRVWLRRDGERMFGFSGLITVRQRRLGPIRNGSSLTSRMIRKGVAGLRRRLARRARPEQIFDRVETAPSTPLHTVFLMVRHDRAEVRVEPISTRRLATCAGVSVQHDLHRLAEHYLAFRFAYPELRNEFLETANRLHGEILSSALRGRQAYAVYHPPNVALSTLYREMEPFS